MNFDEVKKLLLNRHSTYPKQFSGQKIERSKIEKWLELATLAPTHKHTEPWGFIVFHNKSLIDLVDLHIKLYIEGLNGDEINPAKTAKFKMVKEKAAVVVAIICNHDPEKRIPKWEEIAATAMAVQNLYIGLNSLGLAGYWSTGNGVDTNETRKYLNLNENQVHLGWFYVGIKEDSGFIPNKTRIDIMDKTEFR